MHRARWRALVAVLSLAVLASLAAACGGGDTAGRALLAEPRSDPGAPIVVAPGEPIVIGISDAFSGSEGPAGEEDRHGAVTAIMRWKEAHGAKLAGHDIEVRAEDDGCTEPEIAAQAADRLLRTPGLVGVLGPGCSAGAQEAIPLYESAGIVAISGSATRTDLTRDAAPAGYFFRTAYRNDFLGWIGGSFVATTLNARAAYVVDDGEAYGKDLSDAARQAMESQGVSVTAASMPRGTADFSSLAQQIVAADVDFVGFAGFNPDAALFYRQLRDAGYAGSFGAGDAAASIRTFVEPVGAEAAEGVVFAGCPLSLPADFVADFTGVHGDAPEASAFVPHFADAATILLDAVSAVAVEQEDGSLRIDPRALREAVRDTSLDGVSGHITFDLYGDRVTDGSDETEQAADLGLAACQVRDGQFQQLFP